ncbi:MAG: hypothetical protein PUD93_03690 [Lachnospiraceae bacterium]|nr:hypothetical protein [Lachnospiraceae bacterium]
MTNVTATTDNTERNKAEAGNTTVNAAGGNKVKVNRKYKDRIFRMLFKDKRRLLELYNALNGTSYDKEEDLTINTLENAIFMKMKNDVSFIIDLEMCLYEHQSSYCPNMPLRGFFYFADLYKSYILDVDLSVSRRIMIPAPQYIVFYNGTERTEEEFTQRLSESFEGNQEGCMELTVRTININYGHNKELMEKCKPLAEYAYFIAEIRKNLETMSMQEAVEEAVETCIREDVLKEFLLEQKAEVIAMSIYECNEEYVRKTLYEDGYESGKVEGYDSGQNKMLLKNVESAMEKLNINLEQACNILDVELEAYERAKAVLEADNKKKNL